MTAQNLPQAIQAWETLLGSEHVLTSEKDRQAAQTATFATFQTIPAILRPGQRQELVDLLAIANRFRIPVYPVSSGKNWGYGSRVPPADESVLVDLSRLNQIIEYNESLGYVTVEPGVTQRQLFHFLRERGMRFWMDATGSSPDCSLIGNIMERGFGHTPYGEHASHVCGLEVVLPNGEVLHTGAARLPNATTAAVDRWGLGPSLDGLFTQSNLGIVTRLSIQLMPAPEAFAAFFFRCETKEGLVPLIDAVRELRLRELLRSSAHIANDYKVLNGLRQYPWDEVGGATPLTPAMMQRFRSDLKFGFWNVSGGLYGTARQVTEAKRALRQAFRAVPGELKFVNDRMLRTARRFAKPFRLVTGWDMGRMADLVEPVIGLMKGVPTQQPMASAYWRKRMPVPTQPDPDRDRCGLLWYAPTAPAEGIHVARVTDIASEHMLEAGFEPSISLTTISPRTVACVISLNYDRDVAGQDEKARDCYQRIRSECTAEGYYPYRLGVNAMNAPPDLATPHQQILQAIRAAVDPNGILAPKRYEA